MKIKDFYQSLGLDAKATPDEIKKAYRQLAKRYHPDANPNNKQAEERFKEISEAYDVLSDPQKRQKYDQLRSFAPHNSGAFINFDPEIFRQRTGYHGTGEFAGQGFSFSDILRELFGFDSMFADLANAQPEPTVRRAELNVSFEEAIQGAEKTISVRQPHTCPGCHGTGLMTRSVCVQCRGTGQATTERRLRVRIPPGIEDGHLLRIADSGLPTPFGRNDLIITIRVAAHDFFKKHGNDIFCEVNLPEEKLHLGTKIRVKTIDGRKAELIIPPGTKPGTVFRLKNLGVRIHGQQGHQFVKVV